MFPLPIFASTARGCPVAGLFLVLAVLPLTAPRVLGQPTEAQIEAARNRGIEVLRTSSGGSAGHQALVAMTLLKVGEDPEAPTVKATLEDIVKRVDTTGVYKPATAGGNEEIYESGVSIMALCNADSEKYRQQIHAIAQFIISRQTPEGGWDYATARTGDTSVTQYGALGLWDAARVGIRVPPRVWDRLANWHLKTQLRDGGFAYKPGNEMHSAAPTNTMTTAGVSSLYVARLHLYPTAAGLMPEGEKPAPGSAEVARKRRTRYGFLHPANPDDDLRRNPAGLKDVVKPGDNVVQISLGEIDRRLEAGTQWITRNWKTKADSSFQWYYLYTVERYGALAGVEQIGDHDWYLEGAEACLQAQQADGSWVDGAGRSGGTAFAVLFLSRATRKMLAHKVRTRKPVLGTGLLSGARGLPENLEQLQMTDGELSVKKLKGPVADLLAELEKAGTEQLETAQAGLVDKLLLEKPEQLIGQKDRLIKLATDRRPEVRRTAFWALGRTDDQRLAPLLIAGLSDSEHDCVVEAQQALVFLSRKSDEPDLPDEITPDVRQALITRWKTWYFSVRPYDERDDLTPNPAAGTPRTAPKPGGK